MLAKLERELTKLIDFPLLSALCIPPMLPMLPGNKDEKTLRLMVEKEVNVGLSSAWQPKRRPRWSGAVVVGARPAGAWLEGSRPFAFEEGAARLLCA